MGQDAATAITAVGGDITLVGAALVAIAAIYMAVRWVKGAVKGG